MGNDVREDREENLEQQPENTTTTDIQVQHHHSVSPGEWAVQKLFGPTLDQMGGDLSLAYVAVRKKILSAVLNAAIRKTPNLGDGRRVNLRVAHDVLTSGAFSDSAICTEYFGGIMASSRSEDGQDDSAINFVETVKSLSSKQLHLHYALYNGINKLFVSSGVQVDPISGSKLGQQKVWFSSLELLQKLNLKLETDLHVLGERGLIDRYEVNELEDKDNGTTLFYCSVDPTPLGVMFYAVSHNRYEDWREFSKLDFGDYEGISLPSTYEHSIEDLAATASVKISET